MDQKLKLILKKENLEHLLPLFIDQGVTDSILADLSENDLKDLGIHKLGERKRLLSAINGESHAESAPSVLIPVEGGTLPEKSALAGTKVESFRISNFTVTYQEWLLVRTWAVANGFGIEAGIAGGTRHPVTDISWFDAVKWCNAKSVMEGLKPVYGVKGQEGYYAQKEFLNDGSHSVTRLPDTNGYRLPTESEWEWAARGGKNSQGFLYAGSNNLKAVGWYFDNSGGGSHPVGEKAANELGLYDMSGNVGEWCWDVKQNSSVLMVRGGGWINNAEFCTVALRYYYPGTRSRHIGFRLVRDTVN